MLRRLFRLEEEEREGMVGGNNVEERERERGGWTNNENGIYIYIERERVEKREREEKGSFARSRACV